MSVRHEQFRIVLDTPRDTHMFCGAKSFLKLKGEKNTKKVEDLKIGDYIFGEGEVISIEKV